MCGEVGNFLQDDAHKEEEIGEEPLALFFFFSLSTSSANGPHSLVTVSKRVIRTLDGSSSSISQHTRAPDGLVPCAQRVVVLLQPIDGELGKRP